PTNGAAPSNAIQQGQPKLFLPRGFAQISSLAVSQLDTADPSFRMIRENIIGLLSLSEHHWRQVMVGFALIVVNANQQQTHRRGCRRSVDGEPIEQFDGLNNL